jgi:hypothetical protein
MIRLVRLFWLLALLCWSPSLSAAPPAYDLLYVQAPRAGDMTPSPLPDVTDPLALPGGSHLMRWHRATGTTSRLVDAGSLGAVFDPVVSLDGQWVGYSLCPDVVTGRQGGGKLPLMGCSLWKRHLTSGEMALLVDHQSSWRPLESYATWSTRPDIAEPAGTAFLGYGIYHMGLAWLPSTDGKDHFLFTSNMDGLDTIKWDSATSVSFRLWRYDDGVISQVWFPPTSVLHPVLRPDGRVMVSTLENALLGDGRRWGLWDMWPDGSHWGPSMSATKDPFTVPHFCTGTVRNETLCTLYYPFNNSGFGALFAWPVTPQPNIQGPFFGSPSFRLNPTIPIGVYREQYAYTPVGLYSPTNWTSPQDRPSPLRNGVYVGKLSHPWQAPDGILVSYSGGPVQRGTPPQVQAGIALLPEGASSQGPEALQLLVAADPAYNLLFPRPVLSWTAIYGAPPRQFPDVPNDGHLHAALPPGTPYALVTSPTVCVRESQAGQSSPGWRGQRPRFGGYGEPIDSNFDYQGADTRPGITCDMIAALQIVVQGGIPHLGGGDPAAGFKTTTFAAGNLEARHVLGVVPLKKLDAAGQVLRDPTGDPDTSFLVKIPADVAWTFELIDHKGRVLTHSPTWHQARPGELLESCQAGCHTHSQLARFPASQAAASQPDFAPTDLTQQQPYTVEFRRDIAPLLAQHCASCHQGGAAAPGLLDLADTQLVEGLFPQHYAALARNHDNRYGGVPAPVGNGSYGHASGTDGWVSRWVHNYAALRSLLFWVVAGERLDGFTNAEFVSAPVPSGTEAWQVDVDYTDAVHTAHAGLALRDVDRWRFGRWIDDGTPLDTDPAGRRGWRNDVWRPVISWHAEPSTPPVPGCPCPVSGGNLIFGLHDVGSGLDLGTLRVTRDGLPVAPPIAVPGNRWAVPRVPGLWRITIADKAGNRQILTRRVD